jgi:hypothetical protein
MRTAPLSKGLVCLTFVAVTLGCASASSPRGTVIAVPDVRSLSGRWLGTLINDHNMGTPFSWEATAVE